MDRQVSHGSAERGRETDTKIRHQLSELGEFKENFRLVVSGPPSLPGSGTVTEKQPSDRGGYGQQQQYHPQYTAIVSVLANPGGERDQNYKQCSPKQAPLAAPGSIHTYYHLNPHYHQGHDDIAGVARVHSSLLPAPSTYSKRLHHPFLASLNPDILP